MARSRPSSILLSTDGVASSASSTSSKMDLARSPLPKRIRFAPLPEPSSILDNGDDDNHAVETDPAQESLVSSSSSSSSSQLSSTSTPPIPDFDKYSPNSSLGSSPIIQLSPLKLSSTNSSSTADDTATINPPAPPSPSQAPSKHRLSLLRPFKRFSTPSSGSSAHTLTPTPSIDKHSRRKSISAEEIITLGASAINLFRTTSRESTRHNFSSSGFGWGLGSARRATTGDSNASLPSIPLSRTQSSQSYKSKSTSFPTFSPSSSSTFSSDLRTKPKPKQTPVVQQPRTSRHKGTRMLNGRVYGAPKKTNANPFANARDEEPEFVEWGYGGMGSVKGAKSAGVSSNWERLGGSTMGNGDVSRVPVGVGGVGAGIGASDAEIDDGSGSAWVKRRKAERERKAKEQKEKEEEKEAEKECSESQMNTPIPSRSSTLECIPNISLSPSTVRNDSVTHTPPPTIDLPPLAVVVEDLNEEDGETATKANFPMPTPSQYPSDLGLSSLTEGNTNANHQSIPEEGGTSQPRHNSTTHENERVLQAITVPVRSLRHHHHRQFSKGSRDLPALLPHPTEGSAPQIQIAGSPLLLSPSIDGDDITDAATGPHHTSAITPIDKPTFQTSFSSSSSESGSESDGGFDDDDDDDDDEEYEEEESHKHIGRRKTALGTAAGVEKMISRHKE